MARENWDPEMLRFTEMMEARAAAQPPVKLELPLDNSRELNDGLSLPLAKGGAVMADNPGFGMRPATAALRRPSAPMSAFPSAPSKPTSSANPAAQAVSAYVTPT